ncbi:hypothetical protein JOF56_004918 [Kibdelosporangium banguiense]|uniref:ABC transporter permease n=1 Tax=Kibdelosporangium banguiense TaxID=1365924 RepID=A0ABS4TKT5_9PSEU|nr:hypothetical protein [Kibdelosporangium banguiense]
MLLLAENLVNWRAGKKWAALWSTLFVMVVVLILVVLP